jgi:hypothetical protein
VRETKIRRPLFGIAASILSAALTLMASADAADGPAQEAASTSAAPAGARSQASGAMPPKLVAGSDAEARDAERKPASSMSERERWLVERMEQIERRFNERERLLLERNRQLEHRIAELELRVGAKPAGFEKDGGASAAPNRVADAEPLDPPATAGSLAAQSRPPAQDRKELDMGVVSLRPYGFLVANAAYNTYALVPGNIAFFVGPKVPGITGRQFSVSAGNTFVGFDITGPKIGDWAINGKFDFNLRGPTPVTEDNVFAPYFANVYIEAKTGRHRFLAGLASDFISPLSPRSLNLYPGSYLPGDLGTNRPQFRYEYSRPVGGETTFVLQGAVATAVQTFQVSEEVLGFPTDVPDGQVRVAVSRGKMNPLSRKRPFEVGISGHAGQRRALRVAGLLERDFTTWSGIIDISAGLGAKARIEGEAFIGSILGDYKGAILHTFNPFREAGIRAAGGWAQLQYQISSRVSVAGGYALDDTFNQDLSPGFRSRNAALSGNVLYNISPRLVLGLEVSRWRTDWVGLPAGKLVRVEPSIFYAF